MPIISLNRKILDRFLQDPLSVTLEEGFRTYFDQKEEERRRERMKKYNWALTVDRYPDDDNLKNKNHQTLFSVLQGVPRGGAPQLHHSCESAGGPGLRLVNYETVVAAAPAFYYKLF